MNCLWNDMFDKNGLLSAIIEEPDYSITPVPQFKWYESKRVGSNLILEDGVPFSALEIFDPDCDESEATVRKDSHFDWRLLNWGIQHDVPVKDECGYLQPRFNKVMHYEGSVTIEGRFYTLKRPPLGAFRNLYKISEREIGDPILRDCLYSEPFAAYIGRWKDMEWEQYHCDIGFLGEHFEEYGSEVRVLLREYYRYGR